MADENPPALPLPTGPKRSSGTMVASVMKRKAKPGREHARRRTMSGLFTELSALLPSLPDRATRSRIVEEAVAYVGVLRSMAAELEAYSAVAAGRRRTAAGTDDGGGAAGAGAGVVTAVEASSFAVRLPAARRPGSLSRVLEVFQRHGVAVLAATVTSHGEEAAVTVTTAALPPGVAERIEADISSGVV